MIIGVKAEDPHKLEIGKIYNHKTISDLSGVNHVISFLVLRAATYEEWKLQNPKQSNRNHKNDSFFEISTD